MINERIVIEEKTKDYNEAWIETYFWQESEELYPGQKRPVIVICPGGAYGMTSDREAEAIAVRFMGMGYHAVVLRYSVAPARYPVALRQLAKTVALLRENSDKWHIEKNKIIVSGFSAGGHLAASLGVFWNTEELAGITGMENERIRPNGMILNYPVITSGEVGHEEPLSGTPLRIRRCCWIIHFSLFRHSIKRAFQWSIMFFRRDPMGSAWQMS